MTYSVFSITSILISFICFIILLITLTKGLRTWNQNNHAARLTVPATAVTKRADVSFHT